MSEQARNDTNRRCSGNFLQCDAQMVLRGVSLPWKRRGSLAWLRIFLAWLRIFTK